MAGVAPALIAEAQTPAPPHWTAPYNVTWTAQSRNASESMPCGGGDIGLNVWVENGDLLIYLSRSGTFDELNGMPKLGRLRVTLSPNPFAEGGTFRQELRLREGHVEILGEKAGLKATIEVWVDVFRPVVHLDVRTSEPTRVTGSYEGWRLADRELRVQELDANRSWQGAPAKAVARADNVGFAGDAVRFVHRNQGFTCFDLVVAQQELEAVKDRLWNPLKDLTFGGAFSGRDMIPAGTRDGQYASTPFRAWQLESKAPARTHELQAILHVANAKTPGGLGRRPAEDPTGRRGKHRHRPPPDAGLVARILGAELHPRQRRQARSCVTHLAGRPQLPGLPLSARVQRPRRLPEQVQRRALHLRSGIRRPADALQSRLPSLGRRLVHRTEPASALLADAQGRRLRPDEAAVRFLPPRARQRRGPLAGILGHPGRELHRTDRELRPARGISNTAGTAGPRSKKASRTTPGSTTSGTRSSSSAR